MSDTMRPRFDPTISLGNVATVVMTFSAIVAGWVQMTSRVTALEADITLMRAAQKENVAALQAGISATTASLQRAVEALDGRSRETDAETRIGIRRLDDKVTALLMQGFKSSTPPLTPGRRSPDPH